MMNKLFTGVFTGLLLSQAAFADAPAVYRDDVIAIPGGAVIDANGAAFYRNIELVDTGGGNFRIAAAELAELADVERVEVTVAGQTGQAEVNVQGTKSPCVEVLEPAVSRVGNEFIAVLPVSEPETDVCILMLEEFTFNFDLEVGDLEPGTYTIVVNGVEDEFLVQ